MPPLIARYTTISSTLLRVPTYLLLTLYLLVGLLAGMYFQGVSVQSLPFVPTAAKFACCLLIIALWYMNGTALNDYADYEIDLINLKGDPNRPLVLGLVTKEELRFLATSYGITAVGLAWLVSPHHAVLVGVLLILNHSYSLKPLQISRRGGLAPLLLPLGYVALPYFFGYWLVGGAVPSPAWILLAALYLQFMGRIILKDYRDVKGDAAHGKRTFLLRYGNSIVCIVSGTAILTSGLLLVFRFKLGILGYVIVLFTSYALTMLYRLSSTKAWPHQKPLLAAFGRAMTGVTVALIMALAVSLWGLSNRETAAIAIALIMIYLWSAQQAFVYNAARLATHGTKA